MFEINLTIQGLLSRYDRDDENARERKTFHTCLLRIKVCDMSRQDHSNYYR